MYIDSYYSKLLNVCQCNKGCVLFILTATAVNYLISASLGKCGKYVYCQLLGILLATAVKCIIFGSVSKCLNYLNCIVTASSANYCHRSDFNNMHIDKLEIFLS